MPISSTAVYHPQRAQTLVCVLMVYCIPLGIFRAPTGLYVYRCTRVHWVHDTITKLAVRELWLIDDCPWVVFITHTEESKSVINWLSHTLITFHFACVKVKVSLCFKLAWIEMFPTHFCFCRWKISHCVIDMSRQAQCSCRIMMLSLSIYIYGDH